jgi:hypothetical protein
VRAIPFLLALALLLALSLAAVGCGGSSGGDRKAQTAGRGREIERKGRAEGENELEERLRLARRIPASERTAFYQLAIAAGSLRARAAAALTGSAREPHTVEGVRAASARVRGVRPRDRSLRSARRRLLRALAAGAQRRVSRAGAKAVLRQVEEVASLLRSFTRRRPESAALVPD